MEKSIYDQAVDRLHDRRFRVRKKLHERFSKTKPFRGEKMSTDEAFFYYSSLQPQDMQMLIQKHGEPAVNGMIQDMEKYRQEKGNG